MTNIKELQEWIREPDYSEDFSMEECIDWIERRPLATVARLTELGHEGAGIPASEVGLRFQKLEESINEALIHLRHAETFIASREKMHPVGIAQHRECIEKLESIISRAASVVSNHQSAES